MIPAEAVEAARKVAFERYGTKPDAAYLRTILEAAAPHMLAGVLEDAADEFHARLPDGTGNGRAYNSHQVARMLRERAATLRPTP